MAPKDTGHNRPRLVKTMIALIALLGLTPSGTSPANPRCEEHHPGPAPGRIPAGRLRRAVPRAARPGYFSPSTRAANSARSFTHTSAAPSRECGRATNTVVNP